MERKFIESQSVTCNGQADSTIMKIHTGQLAGMADVHVPGGLVCVSLADLELENPLPPDPDGQNDDRAAWAQHAIDAFGQITNMDTAGEDHETMLGDLLANLMHWCDRSGCDFAHLLEHARGHYEAETGKG